MSLLLDALNKADQERKRNEATPGIHSNHEAREDHGPRNHSILLIAVIVIGLLILLAAIYWLGQRSTTPTVASVSAPVVTSSSPKIASNANKTSALNNAKPVEPQQENTNDTTEESVANLYQNTQVPASNAAITISTSPPSNQATQPTTEPVQPNVTAQPTNDPAPVTPQDVATPTSITQFANLPEIHDLPNNILEKVPSLGYSEHNYSASGGSVKINGQIKHVNEQLGNGIVIDKILEDGMILHIDNYSFKMRAMNSWVNM